jgi:hypothetical protein
MFKIVRKTHSCDLKPFLSQKQKRMLNCILYFTLVFLFVFSRTVDFQIFVQFSSITTKNEFSKPVFFGFSLPSDISGSRGCKFNDDSRLGCSAVLSR